MAARKKSRKKSKKAVKKVAKRKTAKKTAAKKKTTRKSAKKPARKPINATAGRFGSYLRSVRLEQGLGLRRVSEAVGMSPAYLSMVERGELDPPTRPKILALAKALGQDKDMLLSLGGKVAADIPVLINRHPQTICALLRATRGMSKDKIDKLLGQAKKLKR